MENKEASTKSIEIIRISYVNNELIAILTIDNNLYYWR